MAHSTKRSRALQAVGELERPEGISACVWFKLHRMLTVIAEHYPKPYPSQERLAALVGCDVRSIRRYVRTAQDHGLLLVKADAGMKGRNNSWSKTNRYLILNTPDCPHPLRTECPTNPPGTTYPAGRELRSSHTPCESSLSVKQAKFDPEGPARQVGPQAKPPRLKTPQRRPDPGDLVVDGGRRVRSDVPSNAPRPPKSQAWRRTASRFLTEWDSMVTATTPGDHLRAVRAADTLGHFQRYLNAHFYGQDCLTPKTEAEVATLIAQFCTDVFRRQITIKDGQSAWMAFTGAWGRNTARTAHSSAAAMDEYFKEKP